MHILHRFYDLHSGGGEVVVATIVEAFPEHEHVLVFNRVRETWLSAKLRAAATRAAGAGGDAGHSASSGCAAPDLLLYHYYPPMTAEDFADLSGSQLARTVVYSHWFRDVPVPLGSSINSGAIETVKTTSDCVMEGAGAVAKGWAVEEPSAEG